MHTKRSKLKENLIESLQWRNYKILFMVNTLIAVLLSLFSYNPELNIWLPRAARHFVFAQCIGNCIYFPAFIADVDRIHNNLLRLLGLTGIFIIGGWIGTSIAIGINAVLFNFSVNPNYTKSFVIGITIFTLFAASIAYSFFVLRNKLQETVARLSTKEINEQRLLRMKTKAELEALRAKVNPHFLFNTLNSISSLIPVDPAKAEEMVQKLSHLFRYILDASNHEFMKLIEEVEFIEEYLEIEKVRLGERLSYNIELDNKLADFSIPGLLLQPLVENSVKHGIATTETGGNIQVKCATNNGFCEIKIDDNGKGFNTLSNHEGFGLNAVRERLALYYGAEYELLISNKNGVQILMRIPIQSMQEK